MDHAGQVNRNVRLTEEEVQQVEGFKRCLNTNRSMISSFPSGALCAGAAYMLRKLVFPNVPWTFVSQSWTLTTGYLIGIAFHRYRLAIKCRDEHFPQTSPDEVLKKIQLLRFIEAEKYYTDKALSNKVMEQELSYGTDEAASNTFDTYTGSDYMDSSPFPDEDLTEPINMKKEMTYEELRKSHREKTKSKPYQGSPFWSQSNREQPRGAERPIEEFEDMNETLK